MMFKSERKKENTPIMIKKVKKSIQMKDQVCDFILEDAMFSVVDGMEKMLDEEHITNMLLKISNTIDQHQTKYNRIPRTITLSNSETSEKDSVESDHALESKEQSLLNSFIPRWCFEDIFMTDDAKRQILTALKLISHQDQLFNHWGLSKTLKMNRALILNFYGQPGTGKSIAAEGVAEYLNEKNFSSKLCRTRI